MIGFLLVLLGSLWLGGCGASEAPATQFVVTVRVSDPDVAARLKLIVASVYSVDANDERSPVEQQRFAIAGPTPQPGEVTSPFSFGVVKGTSDWVKLVIKGYEDPSGESVIEQKATASFQAGRQVPLFFVLNSACYRPPTLCSGLEQTCALRDTENRRAGTCGPVEAALTADPAELGGADASPADAGPVPPALSADGGMTAFSSPEPCAITNSALCRDHRQCEAGDGDSCAKVGVIYNSDYVMASDPVRATAYFKRGCELGSALSCHYMAISLEEGRGVPKDEARALVLYTNACGRGALFACRYLGGHYENGTLGLMRDYARALELFVRGCDGGELLSCNSLGRLYQAGHGVAQDLTRARSLYERACEQSHVAACANLGTLMLRGQGGPQNLPRALTLLTETCRYNEALACDALGQQYEEGLGVAKDVGRALALYRQACEQGLPQGCDNVKRLAP